MTTAMKLFLKQSVLTRSIPFELKLDSDYEIELEDGDYIRTRIIDELLRRLLKRVLVNIK